MKKKASILKALLLLVALALSLELRAVPVFDSSLYAKYKQAFTLNEERKYLEAYQAMNATYKDMMSMINQSGISLSTVDVSDFEVFYWPITRSLAEISYKLGFHSTVSSLTRQMQNALASRTDINPAVANGMSADLKRLDGCSHFLTGNYTAAERELRAALFLKPNDYEFANAVHDDLAQLYYKQKKYAEALFHITTILKTPPFSENYRFPIEDKDRQDIESQYALCLARCGQFDEALIAIGKVMKRCNKLLDPQGYAEALRKKAKILVLQEEHNGKRSFTTVQCYKEYLRITKDYVDNHFIDLTAAEREQYWMTEYPFVTDCYRLEERDPGLLYDVALFSKAVLLLTERLFKPEMDRMQRKEALASVRNTWKDLQKRLPDSVAAIEFISYEKGDNDYLGALVLRSNYTAPKFVPIASLADILEHVSPDGCPVQEILSDPQCSDELDSLYSDRQLKSLLWNNQLVREIGDAKNIYFAPDGIFHQLEIEYLIPDCLQGKRFFRMTSTRLLNEPHPKIRSNRMLMTGGINFLSESNDISNTHYNNDWLAYLLMSSLQPDIPDIPGTLEEINTIKVLRSMPHDTSLTADEATESRVKKLLSDNYPLVHFSTHGFFDDAFSVGTDIRPSHADLQLSHSCLFLSGAQTNLHDKTFNASKPDGVLSARELSQLDLSGVDLMVLSACQSGLGYITPDGVFGLQRGLKRAGVRAVIASLWAIDDEATVVFMNLFYSNLKNGLSLYDAFNLARQQLRSKTTINRLHGHYYITSFDHPYFYNAFILIDGIEL